MPILPTSLKHTTVVGIIAAAVAVLASCSEGARTPSDTAALVAKVGELQAKIGYLSDRQQIHDVYLHYMRGFDRNDVELIEPPSGPTFRLTTATSQSRSVNSWSSV